MQPYGPLAAKFPSGAAAALVWLDVVDEAGASVTVYDLQGLNPDTKVQSDLYGNIWFQSEEAGVVYLKIGDVTIPVFPSSSGGDGGLALINHVNDETPHPAYDDGPSLVALYENAKV